LEFNLDVPIVEALIADVQSCSVVECATAWLKAYHDAQERGADDASALLEAAVAWDLAAAQWRSHIEHSQVSAP
jgi:hypothetical protein